jgi:hypothetical protein
MIHKRFDVALARQTVPPPGLRLDGELLPYMCDQNKRSRPGYNRTAAEAGARHVGKMEGNVGEDGGGYQGKLKSF